MWFNTRAVVLTAGRGTGNSEIVAFDAALRNAGIADFNLIKVTSIVPSHVPVYHLATDAAHSPLSGDGHMLPTVYAKMSTNLANEEVHAAVGVGVPTDPAKSGVIFINEQRGGLAETCVHDLQQMVLEGMKMLRRTDAYTFQHASASAVTVRDGVWCSAVAALCFADDDLWPYFSDRSTQIVAR